MRSQLPIDLEREIDHLCDDFESAWRSGLKPSLADNENRVVLAARQQLRMELERLSSELGQEREAVDVPPHSSAQPDPQPAVRQTGSIRQGSRPDDSMGTVLPEPSARADLATEDNEARSGHLRILGDYELIREIGRGGQGVVYEARQISLDMSVAVKALPFAKALNANALQRFKNEAKAAAQLRHPNILPVHAFGSERGMHYYVMDYIEGGTLEDLVNEIGQQSRKTAPTQTYSSSAPGKPAGEVDTDRASTPSETKILRPFIETISSRGSLVHRDYFKRVTEIGIGVAEALHYAHENGVIHRDIKPSNLLFDAEGRVWVADFGLAQLESNPDLTKPGEFMGTLRYMSPEQGYANRVTLDGRTDVFSLGATLYELLTLRPAFAGATKAEVLRQVAFEEPLPPRKVDPRIPKDLETIVMKALEKKPESRYDDAQQLADDLRACVQHRRITARPPTVPQRAGKWAKKTKHGSRRFRSSC